MVDSLNELRKIPVWVLVVLLFGGPTVGSGIVQAVNPNVSSELSALTENLEDAIKAQTKLRDEVYHHKEQDVAQFGSLLVSLNTLTSKLEETERRMLRVSEELEDVIDGVRGERDSNSEYQKTISYLVSRIDDSLDKLSESMLRSRNGD